MFYLSDFTLNLIIIVKSWQIKMMDKKNLTAINFLKSQEMRQKYECGICYQVCIKPVKCKGPCNRIYCMKCVSDTRLHRDQCPVHCSSPFLVELIPDLTLEFYCPYNPSQCHTDINSVKSFNAHYKSCPYVSQDQLRLKKLQAQYKCLNSHQLQFFIGSYQEMVESECKQCKQIRLCRSYCRICQDLYCVMCRIPPCSKQGCPLGHKFNFQKIANIDFICDICGISTSVSNDGVYDDTLCNFGLCQDCYSTLPDKYDESKPKSLISNINTECSCGLKLTMTNSILKSKKCSLCTKIKQCPKECKNCKKYYCISCKIVDIQNDNTCIYEHDFDLVPLNGLPSYVDKISQFGCMRCRQPQHQYYQDKCCHIRLCADCFYYCKHITIEKERPIMKKCRLNHVLTYIVGPSDTYDICVMCQKQKILRLKCLYCSEDGQGYCFQCKPIKLETCYYKHKLKFTRFQSQRECHFCLGNFSQFFYCKKCYFYVCRDCVHKSYLNQQNQVQKMEEEKTENGQIQHKHYAQKIEEQE